MRSIELHLKGERIIVEMPPVVTTFWEIETSRIAPLASLALHISDLRKAEAFLKEIRPDQPVDLRTGLFEAALTTYFKCFKRMAGRVPLEADVVFANEGLGRQVYDHCEAVRDKHVVHDDNGLAGVGIGAALAPIAPDGPISEIVTLQHAAVPVDEEALNNLRTLVAHALKWTEAESDDVATSLRQELLSEDGEPLENRQELRLLFELDRINTNRGWLQ